MCLKPLFKKSSADLILFPIADVGAKELCASKTSRMPSRRSPASSPSTSSAATFVKMSKSSSAVRSFQFIRTIRTPTDGERWTASRTARTRTRSAGESVRLRSVRSRELRNKVSDERLAHVRSLSRKVGIRGLDRDRSRIRRSEFDLRRRRREEMELRQSISAQLHALHRGDPCRSTSVRGILASLHRREKRERDPCSFGITMTTSISSKRAFAPSSSTREPRPRRRSRPAIWSTSPTLTLSPGLSGTTNGIHGISGSRPNGYRAVPSIFAWHARTYCNKLGRLPRKQVAPALSGCVKTHLIRGTGALLERGADSPSYCFFREVVSTRRAFRAGIYAPNADARSLLTIDTLHVSLTSDTRTRQF